MLIRVSIVEDDPQVRKCLAKLIDSAEGFRCVGQHPSAEKALEETPFLLPDVVLVDISLPGMDGVEFVRRLSEICPETLSVMLTAFENINLIMKALSSGAYGYLLKRGSAEQIISAIRNVYEGGSPMSSAIARRVVDLFRQAAVQDQHTAVLDQGYRKLSTREQQVLDCLANGYTYEEISVQLKISYATVHTHIRHLYKKLQVDSRARAIAVHFRQATSLKNRLAPKSDEVLNQVGFIRKSALRAS